MGVGSFMEHDRPDNRRYRPEYRPLGRSVLRNRCVAHALLRAASPLLATCLPGARLYGYREHSGRALQTPRPPRSRWNRCRHEWRHGTLKACATSGDTAPGESVLLAVAELLNPILHHADHFLCPRRVFDRRGDDETVPVGRDVVLRIVGPAQARVIEQRGSRTS